MKRGFGFVWLYDAVEVFLVWFVCLGLEGVFCVGVVLGFRKYREWFFFSGGVFFSLLLERRG